ncbi:PREDICTED: uncharacterized protein LOC106817676, partial [Priapulus caudatus]|uniref:Uncharacterized protein LOC106817676 n=1 Tax=Priapulus caudatus TaxID=37621 RepID=A0ABM1F075_PRICU
MNHQCLTLGGAVSTSAPETYLWLKISMCLIGALVSSNSIQDADWKLVKSNDRLPDVLESAMIDHEKHVDSQETVITSADKIHDLANRLPIKGEHFLLQNLQGL